MLPEVDSTAGVLYPQRYQISGAGSQINGTYQLQGVCNDRPYYKHISSDASLWYFKAPMFPISFWSGWYISKEVQTSSTSASNDYYAVYTDGKLPPGTGWRTLLPGISPTSGCGTNPPPASVHSIADDDAAQTSPYVIAADEAERLACGGNGSSDVLPVFVRVSGAGSVEVNGIYTFVGELNNRPVYKLLNLLQGRCIHPASHASANSIWYFASCPISNSTNGAISYNGWYISRDVETSSYSAGNDMYSLYKHTSSLPFDETWTTRKPGVGPFAGCGLSPPPRVIPASAEDITSLIGTLGNALATKAMLLRVSLPDGRTICISISEQDTVDSVRRYIDTNCKLWRVYQLQLTLRRRVLSDLAATLINDVKVQKGDIILAEELPMNRILELRSTIAVSKNILVVGAGPVGLWTCIHLKIWRPEWIVHCFEKRQEYSRSHAIRLDEEAFSEMVSWKPGCPPAAELQLLKSKWLPRTRTSHIEDELRQLALYIGVKISYNQLLSLDELIDASACRGRRLDSSDDLPEYDIVVCCDGANSRCRSSLLSKDGILSAGPDSTVPSEFRLQKELGSLLQVKFEAHGSVQTTMGVVGALMQNLPAEKQFFNILSGNFDATKCSTPMTVFALLNGDVDSVVSSPEASSGGHHLDGSVGDHTSGAESKKDLPTRFSEVSIDGVSASVLSELEKVLSEVCPSGVVSGSLKVSVLPVAYKVASRVSFFLSDRTYFLAGDAALGLPLEKGLNFGWRIAARLARYISHCDNMDQCRNVYESYFSSMAQEAVEITDKAYETYITLLSQASLARSILKPLRVFASRT